MKGKDIDTKIDELAQTVASGFAETKKEIRGMQKEIHGVRSELSKEIEELTQMTARGFSEVQENTSQDITQLRGDVDIMLDRHIGTFRKDYDDLARRVKDLEKRVFAH
ncbi:MAG TPA: hypothetical protein VJI70_02685 [Candidatus Paceibacterota bacterium]